MSGVGLSPRESTPKRRGRNPGPGFDEVNVPARPRRYFRSRVGDHHLVGGRRDQLTLYKRATEVEKLGDRRHPSTYALARSGVAVRGESGRGAGLLPGPFGYKQRTDSGELADRGQILAM